MGDHGTSLFIEMSQWNICFINVLGILVLNATSFNTNYNNSSSSQEAEKSSGSSSYFWGMPSTIRDLGRLWLFTQDHGSCSALLFISAPLLSLPLGSCLFQAKVHCALPSSPKENTGLRLVCSHNYSFVKGHGSPSSILAWRIPWTEEPSGL